MSTSSRSRARHAAAVPRPVLLRDPVGAIAGALAPRTDRDRRGDRRALGGCRRASPCGTSPLASELCGPAAAADDEAAGTTTSGTMRRGAGARDQPARSVARARGEDDDDELVYDNRRRRKRRLRTRSSRSPSPLRVAATTTSCSRASTASAWSNEPRRIPTAVARSTTKSSCSDTWPLGSDPVGRSCRRARRIPPRPPGAAWAGRTRPEALPSAATMPSVCEHPRRRSHAARRVRPVPCLRPRSRREHQRRGPRASRSRRRRRTRHQRAIRRPRPATRTLPEPDSMADLASQLRALEAVRALATSVMPTTRERVR